jgi:hypothetical protein
MRSRPNQVDAHEQRHGHAKENAEEREPKIVEAYGFVVGCEDVPRQKAFLWRVHAIRSAVVVNHGICVAKPLFPLW